MSTVSSSCGTINGIIEGNLTDMQKKSVIRTSVVQTPVITSVGHSTVLKANATCVPTAVVVTRSTTDGIATIKPANQVSVVSEEASQIKVQEASQPLVQSVSVTPMVQLLIRLPDGQTMPVQIPVVASTTSATARPAQTVASIVPQTTQTTSLVKTKLKEVLRAGQKCGSGNKFSNGVNEKFHVKSHVQVLPVQESFDGLSFSVSPPSSPLQRPALNGRKRRDTDDDPNEKRRKSLERNRAAATRCRQKRKQWIQALEKKADELAHTNVHLQHEVSLLRNEVTHLKTMLLAHKDCPVTLQQKAAHYSEAETDALTTVHIITSTPQDIQCVTGEDTITLPLNVELMEMEVNSSQSGSDGSITSDASEISCRER